MNVSDNVSLPLFAVWQTFSLGFCFISFLWTDFFANKIRWTEERWNRIHTPLLRPLETSQQHAYFTTALWNVPPLARKKKRFFITAVVRPSYFVLNRKEFKRGKVKLQRWLMGSMCLPIFLALLPWWLLAILCMHTKCRRLCQEPLTASIKAKRQPQPPVTQKA